MRSINELTIRGSNSQLTLLLEQLDRFLTDGWRRDLDAEARLQNMGIRRGTCCYACSDSSRHPAAVLWVKARGLGELYVSNIVHLGKGHLTDEEYNQVLADFESTVVRPASQGLAVEITLVRQRISLDVYLSSAAVRRLEAFSAAVNKTNLNSEDARRWRDFVVQAHLERAGLDPTLLEEWLAQQGWPEEQRRQLLCEYDSARAILSAYDEERLDKCLA